MFAHDELTPHGMDAWRPYCDRPLKRAPVRDEIDQLRDRLRRCELLYGRCHSDGTVDGMLLETPTVVAGGDSDELAAFAALVFRDDG